MRAVTFSRPASLGVLAITIFAAAGLCSAASASASVETYVGCASQASTQPAHVCHRGSRPGAFFRSSTDTEYDVCVTFPSKKKLCAEHQAAEAGTLYVNEITSGELGAYSVVWTASEGGEELGSWEFRMTGGATALTPATASAAFRALILEESPDAVFPRKEGKVCPGVYGGGKVSFCYAEYRTGRTWHLDGASAQLENGAVRVKPGTHAQWRRRWRRCRLRHGTPGRLVSNNGCGRGTINDDAYLVEVELIGNIRIGKPLQPIGWQFTYSEGFGAIGIFHGRRSGRTLIFTNAVGDSFKYTP
jgi:hypothetical protein